MPFFKQRAQELSTLALLSDLSFQLAMVLAQLEHQLGVCVLRPQFREVKRFGIHLGGPLLIERRYLKLMLKIIHTFWPQNLIWAL